LARAETESTDLYGIQVYRKESGKDTYNYFAYGLFDNVNDMKINLLEGSAYKFVVLLVKDAKNKISTESYSSYGNPFMHGNPYYSNNTSMDNTFNINSSYHFETLKKGYMNSTEYPEADWYYGETEEYTPSVDGTVNIDLKHTVFGLQYEVSGITDGTVSITIKNGTRTFFTKSDITTDYTSEEKIIAFYDTYSAWQYADNYTENLSVAVDWTRGIGVLQPLGTKDIQVKRNMMNVVRIQLGSNDGSATFGITTEDDTTMTEESVDAPLKKE